MGFFPLPGTRGIGFDVKVTGDWDDLNTQYPPASYANKIALVTDNKTVLGYITKHNGLYISNGSVWNKMNLKVEFLDDTLVFRDDADTSKQMKFQLSPISPNETRTLTMRDADLNLGSVDYWDFDTSFAGSMQEGRMAWNSDDGTLNLGMPGGNVNLQIGQESLIRVKASEAISNGELVYIDGADGVNPTASLASASNSNGIKTLAMATEDISNGQTALGFWTTR